MSFEMAATKLGINFFDLNPSTSSIMKKESINDTIKNLEAIGMDLIIVRSANDDFFEDIESKKIRTKVQFINAGLGVSSHPTQALLDFYTMKRHFASLEGKKIVIVGDIKHSRVAKSNIELLKLYDADIHLCFPEYFADESFINDKSITCHNNLQEALIDASAVMALRIQQERLETSFPIFHFVKNFHLDVSNFPPYAILMHPGPVNENIEISEKLLDTQIAKTILEQTKNGVFVRMAVLEKLLGKIQK